MSALLLRRISVGSDRISILIELAPGAPRQSTPQLAARLLDAYPELRVHRCANDVSPLLISVLDHTAIPHLLEHLILSEQARNEETPRGVSLVGTTTWLDQKKGTARVEVSFADDMVALAAIKEAASFLNECLACDSAGESGEPSHIDEREGCHVDCAHNV